jgi:alanyl-tRNA synthetase
MAFIAGLREMGYLIMYMHDRLAHTAEHAFIGSLQKLLGQTLKVRKVEHKGSNNTAIIVIPQLELDVVFKAEREVNALIAEGRKIEMYTFSSLNEAKKQMPNLRANEERISLLLSSSSDEVRVVEIENHDVAACSMEHASNLQECDFFLVTRVSKNGNEFEVDFAVGRQAKDVAVSLSTKLLSVCRELGANINTIENTVRKLKSENDVSKVKLKALTKNKLQEIEQVSNGKITLLKGVFSNLLDDQIREFAGEKIATTDVVAVLLANVGGEMASIVLARNEKMMADIDFNKLFRQFAIIADGNRGGGKPHFVTGVVKSEAVTGIIEGIAEEILHMTAYSK